MPPTRTTTHDPKAPKGHQKSKIFQKSTILGSNLRNQAKSSSPAFQASKIMYFEMVKLEFRPNFIIFVGIFIFFSLFSRGGRPVELSEPLLDQNLVQILRARKKLRRTHYSNPKKDLSEGPWWKTYYDKVMFFWCGFERTKICDFLNQICDSHSKIFGVLIKKYVTFTTKQMRFSHF